MKKYFGIFAAIVLVATLSVVESYAQPSGKGKMGASKGTKFVDLNNDGVCDNNLSGQLGSMSGNRGKTRPNFIDANGDGVCDNNTTGTVGAGMRNQGKTKPNFVDANADGICDNNTTGTVGAGMGNRGKTRPNFIDADGDGVCDHFVKTVPTISK
jgi:hypothetical protein